MKDENNAKDVDYVYSKQYAEVGKRYKVYRRASTGGTVDTGDIISMKPTAKKLKVGNAICTEEYTFHYIFQFENHAESISKQELCAGMYALKEVANV